MNHLIVLYRNLQTMLKDENGATMIEYSLMVALIATVAFAAVQIIGVDVNAQFANLAGLFP